MRPTRTNESTVVSPNPVTTNTEVHKHSAMTFIYQLQLNCTSEIIKTTNKNELKSSTRHILWINLQVETIISNHNK